MSGFCTNCGEKLTGGKFCSVCGTPIEPEIETTEAVTSEQLPETRAEGGIASMPQPSGEIILCPDGTYRWAYDLNLFTNPTILLMLWKIFGFIILGLFVFISLISAGTRNFWFEGFLELAKVFGFLALGMMALTLVGYLVYAVMVGGKYSVLFEMNEKGVRHTQAPKQFEKARIMAMITALTARTPSAAGAGLLAGSKSSSYSDWEHVKSVYCYPLTHVIKVNAPLNKNQVYAGKEDFEFVREYIVSHCKNAKIKG